MNSLKQFICLLLIFNSFSVWSYETITLDGDNRDYKCKFRSVLLKGISSPAKLPELIKTLNLSTNCLSDDQRHFVESSNLSIRGLTFGTHASVSNVVSVEGGAELVITVHDNKTLMVGLVNYEGGGASVSLPVGASITKGAIHGKCKSIENYLGNFQTFSLFGVNKSFGTVDEVSRNPKRTYCDSSSNTVGASLALVGYSMTHYHKASPFYLLKGERVEELIEFITRYHPISE